MPSGPPPTRSSIRRLPADMYSSIVPILRSGYAGRAGILKRSHSGALSISEPSSASFPVRSRSRSTQDSLARGASAITQAESMTLTMDMSISRSGLGRNDFDGLRSSHSARNGQRPPSGVDAVSWITSPCVSTVRRGTSPFDAAARCRPASEPSECPPTNHGDEAPKGAAPSLRTNRTPDDGPSLRPGHSVIRFSLPAAPAQPARRPAVGRVGSVGSRPAAGRAGPARRAAASFPVPTPLVATAGTPTPAPSGPGPRRTRPADPTGPDPRVTPAAGRDRQKMKRHRFSPDFPSRVTPAAGRDRQKMKRHRFSL